MASADEDEDPDVDDVGYFCEQEDPKEWAILTPDQWEGVTGGMNRSESMGALAYGTPKNASTGPT